MREQELINVPVRRRPTLGRDLADATAVREGLKAEVDKEAGRTGGVQPALRRLTSGWEEDLDLSRILRDEPTDLAASLLRHQAERRSTRRCFRIGVVDIPSVGGVGRAAGLLEFTPAQGPGGTESWWLAYRLLGPGGAVPFLGEWREERGDQVDDLEPPFRDWLATGGPGMWHARVAAAMTEPVKPRIHAEAGDQPVEPPPDARNAAFWAGVMIRDRAVRGEFRHVTALVFRDGTVEHWEFRSADRISLDDMLRNITALAPVDAVALVHPADAEGPDGEPRKAISVVAECEGRAWLAVWHLIPGEGGEGGEVDVPMVFDKDLGEVGHGSWIGTKPSVGLDLTMPVRKGPEEQSNDD